MLTADDELLDRLLATLAAVGLEPRVMSDAGALRAVWRDATAVTVGGDRAEQLVALGLPRRPDVFVAGADQDSEQLCRWSVPLGAAVAPLPSSDRWFATALADAAGLRTGAGRLLVVLGAAGGVGGSTCAVALAMTAAADGRRTMLVDADLLGGGLDLLVGAEHVDGWRWPHLIHARGHLGDLTGQLPYVDGVDLLASGRGADPPTVGELGVEQIAAVLGSATRSHDLTVVDLPRRSGPAGLETIRRADLVLVVVRADLRGLAAAREVTAQLPTTVNTQVLLRSRRSATIGPDQVEQSLGVPVLASVADDPAVLYAAERGETPGLAGRSSLARACCEVLTQLPDRVVTK